MEKISDLINGNNFDADFASAAIVDALISDSAIAKDIFNETEMRANSGRSLYSVLDDTASDEMEDAAYAWLNGFVQELQQLDVSLQSMGVDNAEIWADAWQADLDFAQYIDGDLDSTIDNLDAALVAKYRQQMLDNISQMVG
jgi:hypothetical protein